MVRAAFDRRHRQLFGHNAPEELVEVVTYRVVGIGKGADVELPKFKNTGGTLKDAYLGDRDARFMNETHPTPVYQRERLDVGLEIKGPAVVEQLDSTLVINPGQTARVDDWKNIIISREG